MKQVVLSLGILLASCLSSAFAADKSEFLIPNKVHFVWMGNKIRQNYINNIRSFVSRNPDYKFTFWIDKQSNFELPNALLDSGSFPIQFRDLNEVVPHLPSKLRIQFEKERVGVFPNYAAASDIIRIQILLEEGGIYFDTDVFMREEGIPRVVEKPAADQNQKQEGTPGVPAHILELAEYIRVLDDFENRIKNFKHIQIIQKGNDIRFTQFSTRPKTQEVNTQTLRAPVSRLGDIYAPFGFLFEVEIKDPSAGDASALSFNNNVLAAVKDSYFLKQIQEQMILKHQTYETQRATSLSKTSYGKVKRWSPDLWVYKRYNPGASRRFDMTIELTGPGVVSDTVWYEVYTYLNSLPLETVDLLVHEFPGLADPIESAGLKRFDSIRNIHDKYFFEKRERLLTRGFKFNLPGFRNECDNTWTEDKIQIKEKRPAEWH